MNLRVLQLYDVVGVFYKPDVIHIISCSENINLPITSTEMESIEELKTVCRQAMLGDDLAGQILLATMASEIYLRYFKCFHWLVKNYFKTWRSLSWKYECQFQYQKLWARIINKNNWCNQSLVSKNANFTDEFENIEFKAVHTYQKLRKRTAGTFGTFNTRWFYFDFGWNAIICWKIDWNRNSEFRLVTKLY